jgi:acetolactate synthase-1/3 small subunit
MNTQNTQGLKKNIHTVSLLVANKPGVLVRIALVFARRGFNIDALVVSPTFDPRYSRMTITAQGDANTLDQIIKQTAKLVDVLHSGEHNEDDAIHRELALVKIKNIPSNKSVIAQIIKKYSARVVEEDEKTMIIVQSGTTDELDQFELMIKKYGIIEMVRSGKLVMSKGSQET